MDNVMIDYIVNDFKRQNGIDLKNDKMAVQRLREGAEKAKVELSSTLSTDINLPFITADATGPKHLTMTINRSKLEELVNPIIEKCKHPLQQAIDDAKLRSRDIDKIIMVGGPTRMPIVQKFLEDYVGKKIERGIDPMECVAMGAAAQAAIIKGDVKDVLLLDVTPLSLGIETLGQIFTKLIERNTTVPTKKSQVFSTAADNQPAVTIRVLQGERQMANDNVELGRFDLVGIPPAPRGIPQIEVTFDIDQNGIVHVNAKDLGTGKEQSIKISAPKKLSEAEIEKMVKDAEQFAEEDKKRKESVETKNQADTLIYSTEKALKDYGDKVSDDEKKAIESNINDLKEKIKTDNIEDIKGSMELLTKSSHKLAEEIYKTQAAKQQQAGGQGQDQGSPAEEQQGAQDNSQFQPGKDDVVDAEYKEDKGK